MIGHIIVGAVIQFLMLTGYTLLDSIPFPLSLVPAPNPEHDDKTLLLPLVSISGVPISSVVNDEPWERTIGH